MKKQIVRVLAISAAMISLAACSTTHRGSVVMKISDNEAHVGMGEGEVSTGDHVQLYHNICTGRVGKNGDGTRSCKKESSGHGEVTQVINSDYSVVKFPAGTTFSEGDTLEKHSH